MHKFKKGQLHSGSGGKVTDRKQAIAIMLSEKKSNKKEYIGPSDKVKKKHGVK